MKYLLSIITLCTILFHQRSTISAIRPPGTIKISDNFYADVQEIANIDYKEYLSYLRRVWGRGSDKYIAALPDTAVWRSDSQYNEPYVETYFRHSAYNNYPIVGVSLVQAKEYSKWRSDRVTEMLLINEGMIKKITDLNKDNYFSIDRYKTGGFDWILVHKDIEVAKYMIPTESEWEIIARGTVNNEYGIDSLNRKTKRYLKRNNGNYFRVKRSFSDDVKTKVANSVIPSTSGPINSYGLRNVVGNVAEMVLDEKVKGGSWNQYLEESQISKSINYSGPNNWTGFRNICRFEKLLIN